MCNMCWRLALFSNLGAMIGHQGVGVSVSQFVFGLQNSHHVMCFFPRIALSTLSQWLIGLP